MPKIITDLRNRLLHTASEIIESKGPGAFSRKELAKESEIAVGTIYNYFPDKNSLLICIAIEDWNALEGQIRKKIGSLSSFDEGVRLLYDSFSSFSLEHQELFSHVVHKGPKTYYDSYINFVEKGNTLLKALCDHFHRGKGKKDYRIAASIFSFAIHYPDTPFSVILSAVKSLL